MEILGIDEDDLDRLRKGHEFKCPLAWLVHRRTMATRAWLSDRLKMGYPTTMSTYIKRGGEARSGPIARLRKKLDTAYS